MIKLAKYLKPFLGLLTAAIILLFIQAMCDLSLPDYMSNIVNIGIQQGGVKSPVPEAIRGREMSKVTIFLSKDNKDEILGDYTLVDKNNSDYDKYVKKYPALKNEPVYVLNDISKAEKDKISPIMRDAIDTVGGISQAKASAKNGFIQYGKNKIPASTDLFAMMQNMPDAQRAEASKGILKQISAMGGSMLGQMAAATVKAEYKALGMNISKIQSHYIIGEGILMLLISLFSAFCTVLVGLLASRTAAGLARNLRRKVFTQVESFSSTEFDKFSTASLITRTTNDITQVQILVVMGVRMIIYAPIIGVGGVIKAVHRSVSMSWTIALAVGLLIVLIAVVFTVALPKFKAIQKLIDKLNLVTRENLSGMMVIRAFNTQKFEEQRFDKANKDLTDTNLFVNRVMVVVFPVMMFIMNGVTVLIVWVGAHQVADAKMQVGDMMAFMQYAMQILFAFLMMAFMFIIIPRSSVSAQRIAEVLETKPSILDPKQPKHFDKAGKGVVEFRNVSFRYPGAEDDVLKDITFTAKPGQTTAFIGSTGAGKTTLVNLLPRFYDITGGQILIDGVDIREATQHELRDQIGYIPQKGSLFQGTIESNLRYANESASQQDLERAGQIAQAMEFINEKPEGFETEISQGGTNVSGGQRQRLSIARALVKKPKIYIFDDSFSALDFKTDSALRKALKENTADSNLLIVAQRISTIRYAEQIIVLDEGKIVGIGTHDELMKNCETYKEIALSQLSKEELA